ncbi:Cilia- and flagella-associated protein 20 [Podila humilis]|nr:Cilia- and flagella-associated protein 20 [Podila humilis]
MHAIFSQGFCPFSIAWVIAVALTSGNRSDPLQLWGKRVGSPPSSKTSSYAEDNDAASTMDGAVAQVQEPHIEFVIDETLNSQVLELVSTHLPSTFITTPSLATRTLGIKLPILVLLVKNLGKYWSFEVTVLDDRGERRRFRASNFQTVTRVKPFITTMPLRMDAGWNQIQLNLADYTKRAYGTTYTETLRITIHANCRLRRVYFSDQIVLESELPAEFKLYLPVIKA